MSGSGVSSKSLRQIESIGRGRETDIEENQIDITILQDTLGRLGGWCFKCGVTGSLEFEAENPTNVGLVVNDENPPPHTDILPQTDSVVFLRFVNRHHQLGQDQQQMEDTKGG